jgi:outer membrane protein
MPRSFLRQRILAAGLLCLVSSAHAEDLLSLYRLARENDPKFRAAASLYLAEREKLPQARAGLMPALSARVERNRNNYETATDSFIISRPSTEVDYSALAYSLRLSQPVFNAATIAGFNQAKAEVRRAEAEYAVASQDLILRVAQAYLDILLAQDALEFARRAREAILRQLESAEARLKEGLATITDVHDARARFALAVSEETEAQNALQDKREALRALTGRSPDVLARFGDSLPLFAPEPADIHQWVERSLMQNYSLRAKRASAESARAEIKRQRAGHSPTLDLVVTRSRNDDAGSFTGPGIRTDSTIVGLQLDIPLFQGGLVSSRTEEAVHRHGAAEQDFEATRRAIERQARASYLGATAGVAKITALRQAVMAGESALEAKIQGFAAGINTNLDVLDATRDLYRARRDLSSAQYDYLLNHLRLKQAAGILDESDLVQINNWLQ